jgi:hypothetical protein
LSSNRATDIHVESVKGLTVFLEFACLNTAIENIHIGRLRRKQLLAGDFQSATFDFRFNKTSNRKSNPVDPFGETGHKSRVMACDTRREFNPPEAIQHTRKDHHCRSSQYYQK